MAIRTFTIEMDAGPEEAASSVANMSAEDKAIFFSVLANTFRGYSYHRRDMYIADMLNSDQFSPQAMAFILGIARHIEKMGMQHET